METELRRNQVSLVSLGTGIILVGAWSVLKAILYFWTKPGSLQNIDADPMVALFTIIIVYCIMGLVLFADLWLRVYLGRAAQAEGRGERQKNTYLYLASVFLFFNVVVLLLSLYVVFSGRAGEISVVESAVAFLIDLTSCSMLANLLITVKRVRRLRASLEG